MAKHILCTGGAGCKPSDFVSLCTCGLSDLTRKPRSLDLVGNRHTVIPLIGLGCLP